MNEQREKNANNEAPSGDRGSTWTRLCDLAGLVSVLAIGAVGALTVLQFWAQNPAAPGEIPAEAKIVARLETTLAEVRSWGAGAGQAVADFAPGRAFVAAKRAVTGFEFESALASVRAWGTDLGRAATDMEFAPVLEFARALGTDVRQAVEGFQYYEVSPGRRLAGDPWPTPTYLRAAPAHARGVGEEMIALEARQAGASGKTSGSSENKSAPSWNPRKPGPLERRALGPASGPQTVKKTRPPAPDAERVADFPEPVVELVAEARSPIARLEPAPRESGAERPAPSPEPVVELVAEARSPIARLEPAPRESGAERPAPSPEPVVELVAEARSPIARLEPAPRESETERVATLPEPVVELAPGAALPTAGLETAPAAPASARGDSPSSASELVDANRIESAEATSDGVEGAGLEGSTQAPSLNSAPIPGKAASSETAVKSRGLATLLEQAAEHLAAGRLEAPFVGNALEIYRRALRIDPENAAAHAGLAAVATGLVARGNSELEAGRSEDAVRTLTLAARIAPERESIGTALVLAQRARLADERARRIDAMLGEATWLEQAPLPPLERARGLRALYRDVLAMDPDNEAARSGLNRLGEQLLVELRLAVERADVDAAVEALSAARLMLADDSVLADLEAKLQVLERLRALDEKTRAGIQAELERADAYIEQDSLTTPPGANAYELYRRVLDRVPGHPAALEGMRRIADRYVILARRAVTRGDRERAGRYVDRALEAAPGHEPILALARDLALRAP